MPETQEPRYPCPVCLGLPMQKVRFENPPLTLDACNRCGGMWFDHGEVNQLKQLQPQLVETHVQVRNQEFMMQCHRCETPMPRNADDCPKCHWKNRLECPICQKTMEIVKIGDIKLDVCKTCKGAWFDNIELAALWNGRLDRIGSDLRKQPAGAGFTGEDAAYLFLDVLTYSPDLVYYTGEAVGELIAHTPDIAAGAIDLISSAPDIAGGAIDLLASAPDLAGGLLDGLGEIAGGIFGLIGEILGGIFDN